jgi:DNA-binding CsgD family transcriptional regulator
MVGQRESRMKGPRGGIILRECDAKEIASILGDIAGRIDDLPEKRQRLIGQLAISLSADAWFRSRAPAPNTGEPLPPGEVTSEGGLTSRAAGVVAKSISAELGGRGREAARGVIAADADAGTVGTRTSMPFLSAPQPQERGISWVVMLRRPGRPRFSERELRFANTILSEIPWFHADDPTPIATHGAEDEPPLPPRLAQVLAMLLNGRPRKEIAQGLGISLHTVHGYAKDLYARFGVHSQAELICKLARPQDEAA